MKKRLVLKKKYIKLLFVLSLLLVFTIVLGTSYAFFNTTLMGKKFVVYTGSLSVDYTKKTDVINISNLYPMTNSEGLNQDSHEFLITNNGNVTARYQVGLEIDNSVTDIIPVEYVKLSYSMDGSDFSTPILLSDLGNSLVFVNNIMIDPTKSNYFEIKLWIDLNAPNDVQKKEFKARIIVDSIQNVDKQQ